MLHARVEDGIRHSQDTGLGWFASAELTTNQTRLADMAPQLHDPA